MVTVVTTHTYLYMPSYEPQNPVTANGYQPAKPPTLVYCIDRFPVYLTSLAVVGIIYRQMIKLLMNNDLEIIWKEA
jgi:hypothetical protein